MKNKGLMKKLNYVCLAVVLVVSGLSGIISYPDEVNAAPEVVNISGTDGGRTYGGIGGVFSNGMTKLLMDYPTDQKNDLLDLLFKPKFGASLQHVKVEIGTDVNSSSGTEPSHMRSSTDFNIERGSGLWIAQKAMALNASIELEALRWGTPKWITNDNDRYLYYKKFLDGAQATYGLNFDYIGADKNEDTRSSDWHMTTGASRNFVVNTLRPQLDNDGYGDVGIVAADSNTGWWIADRVATDPDLEDSLAAMAVHYIEDSTANAKNSTLPLWAGEDLAPFHDRFVEGSLDMAYRIMKMYAEGRMVKYEMHPVIESAYPATPFNTKGILVAHTPWSGHYDIQPGLWTTAHFTQFSEIGWKYVDSGNHTDDRGGYMMVKENTSSNTDWSLVVLNKSATPKEYTFNLSGGLKTGTIYPWKTTESSQFIQQSNITALSGSFTVTIDPYSIYTFTTTTGQQKGTATSSNPASTAFTLGSDYVDNYNSYTVGQQPKYISDQGGAFEIVTEGSGKVLEQVITTATKPVDWKYRTTPEPYTLFGSMVWRNVEVQTDVKLIGSSGYVMVGGRVNHNRKTVAIEGTDVPAGGYQLRIHADKSWQFRAEKSVIASGTYTGFATNTWYTVKLKFTGTNIKAYINPVSDPNNVTLLASVTDTEFSSGQLQFGSGLNAARFDNLAIRKSDPNIDTDIVRFDDTDSNLTYVGAWEFLKRDYENYNRTQVGSRTAGNKLQFKFDGTMVAILGTLDLDGGKAEVYIDGSPTPDATIDLYSPTRKFHRAIYTKSGLSVGEHTLELVPLGTHISPSIDDFVRIDSIEVGGGLNTLSKMNYQFINDTFYYATVGDTPPNWIQTTDVGVTSTVELDGSNRKIKLNDTNNTNRAFLERKFAPASGMVTWEFDYKRTTADPSWNRFFLANNSSNAVEIYDTNTQGLAYNKSDGTKVKLMDIVAGTNYAIKVEANTNNKTFQVWVDGVKKTPSTAPSFTNTGVNQVERMRIETSNSNVATTTAYVDNVSITALGGTSQMIIKDVFDEYPSGTEAGEPRAIMNGVNVQELNWVVESADPTNICEVDAGQPGSGNHSFVCNDTISTGGIQATRSFNRKNAGYVTVEYKFRQDSINKWTRFFISNGDDRAIEMYDSSSAGGLAFKDVLGNEILIGSLSANTWYTVKLVIDVDDKKFDAYLDGVPKLMNQAFTNPSFLGIDRLNFQTGNSTSVNLWLDDVKVTIQ